MNAPHSHSFGQENKRPGESRTMIVIAITSVMMVVEISAGILYGSMALLADGLHMASHAVALAINAFAYVYARRHAHDTRFSFGTGKVNALGGFTGAILLAMFALMMAWESVARLISPVAIVFNQAILVALVGLAVNGVSVFILGHHHEHEHEHEHGHAQDEDEEEEKHHEDRVAVEQHERHHDHNLRSAYLHVLADALTSLLAIFALLAAKHLGLIWMDPVMGIVGALLVARWSMGLMVSTAAVLLDRQGPRALERTIRKSLQGDDDTKVVDLHLWSIGPNLYALIAVIVAPHPLPPDVYQGRIPSEVGIAHATIEVHSQRRVAPQTATTCTGPQA